ncbi:MAG: acylneuraminate cytidylyltransferase family protein, partial [Desulfovibrio sp.]|nr:acylneuraminate cytidylyltransferase family protein [Desulfovibrio sp.]
MRNLALIPARGGSKGLPGKNIKEFAGKPLIAWTITAAKEAGCVSSIVVSSEDAEILETSRRWGAETPFVRPMSLAGDTSSSMDVVFHALDYFEKNGIYYDAVILLQPTSPLRSGRDIEEAFRIFQNTRAPACISVTPCAHPPQWNCGISGGRIVPFAGVSEKRRQDC